MAFAAYGASRVLLVAIGAFGAKAYPTMVAIERNVQEFVSNAKTLIVVKSIIVPAANLVANMLQLVNRGVPVRHVMGGIARKTSEVNDYIKRRKREIDIEAELHAAKGKNDLTNVRRLSNELRSIQDAYKRMSIWPLIEAGEFSSISNGQVTAEDLAIADGQWSNWMEKKINSLPVIFRTPLRYGLVTRDTALFKGLARATQYGDFVAKAVLYDDMVKRRKVKTEEAIPEIRDAFVNYNRPAGRGRQRFESVGLLWFPNYKLRIMKEAAYTIRHHPLRTLLLQSRPLREVM